MIDIHVFHQAKQPAFADDRKIFSWEGEWQNSSIMNFPGESMELMQVYSTYKDLDIVDQAHHVNPIISQS